MFMCVKAIQSLAIIIGLVVKAVLSGHIYSCTCSLVLFVTSPAGEKIFSFCGYADETLSTWGLSSSHKECSSYISMQVAPLI
jgi:hypothetical protein